MSSSNLTISNNQGWSIQTQLSGERLFVKVKDDWGQVPKKVVLLLTQIEPADNGKPIGVFLEKTVRKLSAQNNKFGFQVQKHQEIFWVVFGPYGLSGGAPGDRVGRSMAIAGGTAQAVAGAVLIVSGTRWIAVPGAMLISAGVNSALYASRSSEASYNQREYLGYMGLGAASGLISGGVRALNPVVGHAGDVINSVGAGLGNFALFSGVDRENMTSNRFVSTLVGSVLGNGVAQGAGALFSRAVAEVTDNIYMGSLLGFAKGALSGFASAGTSIVAGNYWEGKDLNYQLLDSVVAAAMMGGITGGARNAKTYYDRYKAIRENSIAERSEKAWNKLSEADEQQSEAQNNLEEAMLAEIDKMRKVEIVTGKMLTLELQEKQILANIDELKSVNPQDPQIVTRETELKQVQAASLVALGELDQLMTSWDKAAEQRSQNFDEFSEANKNVRGASAAFDQASLAIRPPPLQFDPRSLEDLDRIFSISLSEITFRAITKEQWLELVGHVVLVHALPLGSSSTTGSISLENHLRSHLTRDGELRADLDYQNQLFGEMQRNPHIHWAWNQLTQRREGESGASLIAVLEPMDTFENGTSTHSLYSISPYDTLTIGKHRLTDRSILLIPDELEVFARSYLTGFRGKIVGYRRQNQADGSLGLRKAAYQVLLDQFPDTWHLIDPNHPTVKIADQDRPTKHGYSQETCIAKSNGEIINLIRMAGDKKRDVGTSALHEALRAPKFIGIPMKSFTFWLEEDHPFFNYFNAFKANQGSVRNNPRSVGYALESNIPDLFILEALKFKKEMSMFASSTKAREVGDYVFYQALLIDMYSVFFANYPNDTFNFTPPEIDLIISTHKATLLWCLETLSERMSDRSSRKIHYSQYKNVFEKAIRSMLNVKAQLTNLISSESSAVLEEVIQIIDGALLSEEWRLVCEENARVDFDQSRPLPIAAMDFIEKIEEILPHDQEALASSLCFIHAQIGAEGVFGSNRKKKLYVEYGLKNYLRKILYRSVNDQTLPTLQFPFGLQPVDKTLQPGNSLFDNIAYQLNPTLSVRKLKEESARLRQITVAYMKENRKKFQFLNSNMSGELLVGMRIQGLSYKNSDDYLKNMAKDNVLPDEHVVQALAFVLNCQIVDVKPRDAEKPFLINGNVTAEVNPLLIASKEQYFCSLYPPADLRTEEIYAEIVRLVTKR